MSFQRCAIPWHSHGRVTGLSCQFTSKECLLTPALATACTNGLESSATAVGWSGGEVFWTGRVFCTYAMSPFLPVWAIKPLLTPIWLPVTRVSLCPPPSALSRDEPQAQEPLTHTEHLSRESLSFAEDVAGLPSQQGQKVLTPEHGSCLLVSD